MSVEFSNAYQEILLDNLVSIIKQNFIFQTQLKLAEESGKAKTEIQVKYEELLAAHEALKDYKMKADSNASAHEEKSRLQSALNDIMKKTAALQKDLEVKQAEIVSLKEYIDKLENIATPSKLKKINPDRFADEKPVEQPAPDLFAIKANDGSSF
jgi:Skp family chaperone for outer membrane proteins